MYEAKILKHSLSDRGIPLVTFEVNYPHAIHKDIMTHRWARNFQSFRAVPTEILLDKIDRGEYFVPEKLSSRVKGMGRGIELDRKDQVRALSIWKRHVRETAERARHWSKLDIAKEQTNFLLQDLCFIRGIITTTMPQLENFFGLRLAVDEEGNPLARLEVHKIASLMYEAFATSTPQGVGQGAWHLPLVTDEELAQGYGDIDWDFWRMVSVGRCARVSYLTHDGVRDPEADVSLHNRLLYSGHMSPFEHQGTPIDAFPYRETSLMKNTGSFGIGWVQYRKLIPGESNYYDLQQLRT